MTETTAENMKGRKDRMTTMGDRRRRGRRWRRRRRRRATRERRRTRPGSDAGVGVG